MAFSWTRWKAPQVCLSAHAHEHAYAQAHVHMHVHMHGAGKHGWQDLCASVLWAGRIFVRACCWACMLWAGMLWAGS